ncbi:MAG: leucyl/phenylalanyl-tRNA--protein transferase [Desulfonauticus sp.]|nr:leucyl/phenylalanyl-tRNA--protein transferase [Desulfonauticus sp.]
MSIFFLTEEPVFPPVELADPDGLLAVGGDLSCFRLIAAYSSGIFPWYEEEGPILWWAPFPRPLIFPSKAHLSKSLKRVLKKKIFNVSLDTCFDQVIQLCAGLREKTWITLEMKRAYKKLHRLGYAHSVEVWSGRHLVGGLYGVSIGRAFFGESMFHLQADASKVGLWALICFLRKHNFVFLDCQQSSELVLRFGAIEVDRSKYLALLKRAISKSSLIRWRQNSFYPVY